MLRKITVVNAAEMPKEVIDYCIDELDTSTHYQNDIVFVENNGNPFAKWLYEGGHDFIDGFTEREGDWIGIFAT